MPVYLYRSLAEVFCLSLLFMQCDGKTKSINSNKTQIYRKSVEESIGNIEIIKQKDLVLSLKQQSSSVTVKNTSGADLSVELRPENSDTINVFPSDFVLPPHSSRKVDIYVSGMPYTGTSKQKIDVKSEKILPGNNNDEHTSFEIIIDTTK